MVRVGDQKERRRFMQQKMQVSAYVEAILMRILKVLALASLMVFVLGFSAPQKAEAGASVYFGPGGLSVHIGKGPRYYGRRGYGYYGYPGYYRYGYAGYPRYAYGPRYYKPYKYRKYRKWKKRRKWRRRPRVRFYMGPRW